MKPDTPSYLPPLPPPSLPLSSLECSLLVNILQHFSEVITWMLSIGRAAHPGPWRASSGTFSIEFLTVGVGCPTEILPWSASLISSRLRNIDESLPGSGLPLAVLSLKKSLRCGLQHARSPLLEDMLESGLLVSAKPLLCFPHFAHLVFKRLTVKVGLWVLSLSLMEGLHTFSCGP